MYTLAITLALHDQADANFCISKSYNNSEEAYSTIRLLIAEFEKLCSRRVFKRKELHSTFGEYKFEWMDLRRDKVVKFEENINYRLVLTLEDIERILGNFLKDLEEERGGAAGS